MKYLSARLFGCVSLLALTAFVVGFFTGFDVLTIAGGIVIVITDLMAITAGVLKPGFPLVLAVIAAVIIDPWCYGVFWASALFALFDIPTNLTRVFRPDITARMSGVAEDSTHT